MSENFEGNRQNDEIGRREAAEAYIAVLKEIEAFEKSQINGKHNLCKLSFKVGGSVARGTASLGLYPAYISFDEAESAETHKRDGFHRLGISTPSDIDILVNAKRVNDGGLVTQGDFNVILGILKELSEKIFDKYRILVSFHEIDKLGEMVGIDEAMGIIRKGL